MWGLCKWTRISRSSLRLYPSSSGFKTGWLYDQRIYFYNEGGGDKNPPFLPALSLLSSRLVVFNQRCLFATRWAHHLPLLSASSESHRCIPNYLTLITSCKRGDVWLEGKAVDDILNPLVLQGGSGVGCSACRLSWFCWTLYGWKHESAAALPLMHTYNIRGVTVDVLVLVRYGSVGLVLNKSRCLLPKHVPNIYVQNSERGATFLQGNFKTVTPKQTRADSNIWLKSVIWQH